jgi:selenobiotic family peptide radical SAM maturase
MSELADAIRKSPALHHERPYLADLAKLEHIRSLVSLAPLPQDKVSDWVVNPSLELVPVHWLKLPAFLDDQVINIPERGDEWVLIWKHPASRLVQICPASGHDLLALKIVSEGLRIRDAAWEGKVTTGHINDILASAVQRGILLAPPSRLERDETFPRGTGIDPHFFSSPTFTLQWHITQACDLHCRHCYDRSERATLELSQGIRVLDDLYNFSATHFVSTQVSFTGGNPLLYPDFNALYKESSDRGFMTAILGNPMPKKQIEKMLSIRKPEFYQVSLEGLRDHNDYIRGSGHFDRTLDFLDLLRELGIYSMVMLTLTRNNRDQVLELAELLRERVDLFTFNRLAMVGEGAALASVAPEDFPAFLKSYRQAAEKNSCIGLKDNLFNLLHHEQGLVVNGGCTGYGCGAGFNFLSLLPDGEVHACRKLPSLIGNAYQQTLDEIYHGPLAQQYRLGTAACRECPIRPVCGGCLAVSHGYGLDIFQERDPYCWKDKKK